MATKQQQTREAAHGLSGMSEAALQISRHHRVGWIEQCRVEMARYEREIAEIDAELACREWVRGRPAWEEG